MLVLTVKPGDSYRVGNAIVEFREAKGGGARRLRMCIDAPRSVEVVPLSRATTAAGVRQSVKSLMR